MSPRPPPKSRKAHPTLPKPQKTNQDPRGTKRLSSDKVEPDKRRKKEAPDIKGFASEEKGGPKKKPISKSKKRASSEISSSYRSESEEEISSKKPVSRPRKNTDHFPKPENDKEVGQPSKDTSSSKANHTKPEASESEMSEVLDEAPKAKGRKQKSDYAEPGAKVNGKKASASDEEMSEVLDEAPKMKGRKRRSDAGKPKTKTEGTHRTKSSEQSADPNADEIKRLQGWLIKCGIRKMWHRELAPYDNPKAKIRHLKELLADAGMTGRYSIEKANQIKEERELRADLEAVQEGAKQWGKAESEEEDEAHGRPKRRLARGLQELSFLNDDDGEETD